MRLLLHRHDDVPNRGVYSAGGNVKIKERDPVRQELQITTDGDVFRWAEASGQGNQHEQDIFQ